MKKLLWMSDNPFTPTGYANQSWNIVNYMVKNGWEGHYLAHNHHGFPLPPPIKLKDGNQYNFTVYGRGMADYCADIIQPKLRDIRPDVFGILLDTFMMMEARPGLPHAWFTQLDLAPAQSLFYFPSDGGGFPINCEKVLQKVNHPIAMSKYAQKQVKDEFGINVDYIPHGVDADHFRPFNQEEKLNIKRKWIFENNFVVGMVARNQGRKVMDLALKSFARFSKDKPDTKMFLHTDPSDGAAVFHLPKLCEKLKITNKVIYSGMKIVEGFDYGLMPEIYNVMDVHFLSTSGEGFGIPTIEAMSCEVPVIQTDYTTTHELVVDDIRCGEEVKVAEIVTGNWQVERAFMSVDDAVDKLNKLYYEKDLRLKYGKAGREKVLKYYDWKIVGETWRKKLEKITS